MRTTQHHADLDLSNLQQAKGLSPEESFLKEVNQIVAVRVKEVADNLTAEMRAGNYKAIKGHAHHSSTTLNDIQKKESVIAAAQVRAASEVAKQSPLFADFTAALTKHGVAISSGVGAATGLIPAEVEKVLKEHLTRCIGQAVETVMTTTYAEVIRLETQAEARKQAQEEAALRQERLRLEREREAREKAKEAEAATEKAEKAKNMLPKDEKDKRELRAQHFANNINGDNFDLNEWIKNSGLYNPHPRSEFEKRAFQEELLKIQRVGVWIDPTADAKTQQEMQKYQVGPNYFRICRAASTLGWIGSAAALTFFTVTLGPASLIGWAPIVGIVNLGVQKFTQFLHDRKFDAMFKEISRELKNAGPMEASVAWAGVMHKFLTDYKPYWFNNDRVEFWQDAENMSIKAALRQLRQAAAHGSNSIATLKPDEAKETFFKDSKFNDYISQNDDAMKSIEARWKHYTKLSKGAAKFGAGVGLMAIFA